MSAKNHTSRFITAAVAFCLFAGLLVRADGTDAPAPAPTAAPAAEAIPPEVTKLISSLKWQTGKIKIKDGLATINLTDNFRFLSPDESDKVLHNLWGNPTDPEVLGMIFPADVDLTSRHSWGVVISYEESGYVKDDDADSINYDDLLKTMKQETHDANAEREKEGGDPIELAGWAAPPRYDKLSHKYYWAEHITSKDGDSLNYRIRVLGRRGVLDLNVLANMEDLSVIDQKKAEILAMVDFQAGNTYADFDPKVDKIAEYGLIGLLTAGGIAGAAKLGLLAGFWKFIVWGAVAFGKYLVIAAVAIGAAVKNMWGKISGGGKDRNNPPPS